MQRYKEIAETPVHKTCPWCKQMLTPETIEEAKLAKRQELEKLIQLRKMLEEE